MTTQPPPGASGAAPPPSPTPPTPPPPPVRDLRLLRRSATDRKIAGVCGGLGEWADIDPVIFRIVLVVLAFFGGLGLIAYGVLWLVVPVEGRTDSDGQRLLSGHGDSSVIWPIIMIVVGLSFAGGSWAWAGRGSLTVLILAAVVVAFVLMQRSRADAPPQGPAPGAPVPGSATPTGSTTPGAGATPGGTTAPGTTAPGTTPTSGTSPTAPLPPYSSATPATAYAPPRPPSPPSPPRERSILGGLTVSVALIAVGLVLSWGFWTGSTVDAQTALSVALGVVGLGLLVGTFLGRGRGLIVLGVILSLIVLTTGVKGVSLHGGVGDRSWHPASVAAVQSPYELSMGNARLDLTDVDPAGKQVDVAANVGIGNLVVLVPGDATVDVRAHVGTGNLTLPDGHRGGLGVDRHQVLVPASGGGGSSGTIVLHLQVGIGDVEVRRA